MQQGNTNDEVGDTKSMGHVHENEDGGIVYTPLWSMKNVMKMSWTKWISPRALDSKMSETKYCFGGCVSTYYY